MNYRAMRYAVEEAEVDGAAWSVLVVIAYRADKTTGLCTASRRRLAREARISTSTVHHALEQLIKAGFLAIVVTGAGRRSTTYQVVMPDPPSGSTVEPVPLSPNGSVGESPVAARYGSLADVDNSAVVARREPVVARSASRSGSIRGSVVARSPDTYIRKEGKNKGKILEGQIRSGSPGDAARDAPPDGVACGSEDDPTAVVDNAVLAVDPDALRDPDGWNLSDAYGRAWLPNEDVAAWLRRYRKAASA